MKFYIYTLGCKVNTYESNVMRDLLINAGFIESKDKSADIYIINTCTVTNTSDNKSLKVIRQFKRLNDKAIIVAVGCMTQVNKEKLQDLNIDIILGNKYKSNIVEIINEYLTNRKKIDRVEDIKDSKFESMCLNNFNKTRAFVKIEDGCENFCSYCIIPYARGKVRSKDSKLVIEEITNLVKNGHEEVVLTGIHTGHYGSDLKEYNFAKLLREIVLIPNLKRLRISSIEINEITDEVLDVFKNSDILVDHIHIPIQSGSNEILKNMNRKYNKQEFIDIINKIRSVRPNISLTTDIIVGFPGETEDLFEETLDTVNRIKFSKIHVFPFSKRKGTVAEKMDNQVDEYIKKTRVKKLIEISNLLEDEYATKFIKSELKFIPEIYKDGYVIGHTGNYLLIKAEGSINDLYKSINVEIIENNYPYLVGKIKR